MHIRVECYSGYRGEETPRRLQLGERRIEIREIVDRWLAPEYRYFKIVGDDGDLYIIRHDVESWKWELTFYRAVTSLITNAEKAKYPVNEPEHEA